MAHDVFDHHHRAIHDHAKIQRAERQKVRGNVLQVQANRRKQQRKRNCRRDNERATDIAKKQKQNDRNQNHPFGQVVKHGMGSEVNQITAIDEWNNLHAWRQNVIVQFLHFLVDAFRAVSAVAPLRNSTMPETTSSLSMILPSSR